MDQERIERAVREWIAAIGEDPESRRLAQTPALVAEAAGDLFAGYADDPEACVEVIEGPDNLILVRDVAFFSFCEHHLLPFFGTAQIAVLPDGGRIAGFSSLARVVSVVSRRLQIQERLTEEVAEAIWRSLRPQGVYVHLQAEQLCMQMRGERHLGTKTVTIAVRGSLAQGPLRAEIAGLLGGVR